MADKETVECRWIACNICGIHPSAGHEDGSPPRIGDPGECISCRGYYDEDGRWCTGVQCEYCDGPVEREALGWAVCNTCLGPNDEIPAATQEQIIAFMEQHEDDWDEVAFNGFGTAHIARMGNLTCGLAESGDFVGIQWPTSDDAKEAVKSTAAGWLEMSDEASHQILKEGEGS